MRLSNKKLWYFPNQLVKSFKRSTHMPQMARTASAGLVMSSRSGSWYILMRFGPDPGKWVLVSKLLMSWFENWQ